MLAFGTLFSCQGAAARAPLEPYAVSQAKLRALVSFRKLAPVQSAGQAHTRCFNVRRAGDSTAAPIQMTNPAWRDSGAPPAGGWPSR